MHVATSWTQVVYISRQWRNCCARKRAGCKWLTERLYLHSILLDDMIMMMRTLSLERWVLLCVCNNWTFAFFTKMHFLFGLRHAVFFILIKYRKIHHHQSRWKFHMDRKMGARHDNRGFNHPYKAFAYPNLKINEENPRKLHSFLKVFLMTFSNKK